MPTAASSRSEPAARGPALPPAWAEGEAAARLPRYLGTALAAALAGPAAQVSDEAVRQDALAARFRLQRQIDCLAALRDAGLTAVALKGFVTAHWLYPQPALRCSGDLDVLLPRGDLQAALELLSAEGYAFRPLPPKPWGFLSRASFQPFASADGVVNLDLHVEPDCWPLERGLPAADLLAAARPMPDLPALAPDPTHLFLLLASNAAKDKFGPFAVKKVLDAYVWLAGAGAGEGSRQAPPLDGAELHRRAQAAGLLRPLGVFLALLADLGVPAARLPDIPPHRPGRAYARLLADWRGSFPEAPSALQRLAREAALGAEPSVAATLAWRRLTGLVRRPTGLPEGWA